MGLGGYEQWFQQEFHETVSPIPASSSPDECGDWGHIFFDLNGLLYRLMAFVTNEEQLFLLVFAALERTLNIYGSTKMFSMALFLDGTAPLAKIELQRARRLRTYQKQARQSQERQKQKEEHCRPFNQLHFTAGTGFMGRFAGALRTWGRNLLSTCKKMKYARLFISGADVPGEADIKIFHLLATMFQVPGSCKEKLNAHDSRCRVAIIGEDADLIILGATALSTCPPAAIMIWPYVMPPGCSRIGPSHGYHLPALSRSLTYLRSTFPNSPASPQSPASGSGPALDLMMISLLHGNDYLPRLRGASLAALWQRYCHLRRGRRLVACPRRGIGWILPARGAEAAVMTDRESWLVNCAGDWPGIRLEALADFLGLVPVVLAGAAGGARLDCRAAAVSSGEASHRDGDDACDWIAATDETMPVLGPAGGSTGGGGSGGGVDEEVLWVGRGGGAAVDVGRYVEGLAWNVRMYLLGECPDYSYRYEHPYAPSARQVTAWIRAGGAIPSPPVHVAAGPVPAAVACLALLPPGTGRGVLPGGLCPLAAGEPRGPLAALPPDGGPAPAGWNWAAALGRARRAVEAVPLSGMDRCELEAFRIGRLRQYDGPGLAAAARPAGIGQVSLADGGRGVSGKTRPGGDEAARGRDCHDSDGLSRRRPARRKKGGVDE